jgi:hypothetical protein
MVDFLSTFHPHARIPSIASAIGIAMAWECTESKIFTPRSR